MIVEYGHEPVTAAHLLRQHQIGDFIPVEERGSRRFPTATITDRGLAVEVPDPDIDRDEAILAHLVTRQLLTLGEHVRPEQHASSS